MEDFEINKSQVTNKEMLCDNLKQELEDLGIQDMIGATKIRSAEENNVRKIETEKGSYILKEGPDLLGEKDRLDWLEGKLPVPKVINWQDNNEQQKLIMSCIEGEDLALLSKKISKEELVKLLANTLQLIHSVDTTNCPFGKQGKDSVFIHGDACLPNFIFHNSELYGIIDLGDAGIGDREDDLAAAVWSLDFNHGPGLGVPFLKAYGLESPTNEDVDRLIHKYENDKEERFQDTN